MFSNWVVTDVMRSADIWCPWWINRWLLFFFFWEKNYFKLRQFQLFKPFIPILMNWKILFGGWLSTQKRALPFINPPKKREHCHAKKESRNWTLVVLTYWHRQTKEIIQLLYPLNYSYVRDYHTCHSNHAINNFLFL